jgi:hypothetical protein
MFVRALVGARQGLQKDWELNLWEAGECLIPDEQTPFCPINVQQHVTGTNNVQKHRLSSIKEKSRQLGSLKVWFLFTSKCLWKL